MPASTLGHFNIEVLGLPAHEIDGLGLVDALHHLRARAAQCCREYATEISSDLDYCWLIENIEVIARPLVSQRQQIPLPFGSDESTERRKLEAAIAALLLAAQGRMPLKLHSLPRACELQVYAQRLYFACVKWLALHELLCGVYFAHRFMDGTFPLQPPKVSRAAGLLTGVHIVDTFLRLSQVEVPDQINSRMDGFADPLKDAHLYEDFYSGVSMELGIDVLTLPVILSLERDGVLYSDGNPRWIVGGPTGELVSRLRLARDHIQQRRKTNMSDPADFVRSLQVKWTAVARTYWEEAHVSDKFPSPPWLPMILPITTSSDEEVLVATSASDYLMSRLEEMYLNGRVSPSDSRQGAALIKRFQRLIADRVAAHQVQLLFPQAEIVNGVWTSDRYHLGLKMGKSVGGVPVRKDLGDIDLILFDKRMRRICVVEAKYHWAPERLWGYANEYKKLGPNGVAAEQLRKRVAFVRSALPDLRIPHFSDDCREWQVEGVVLTNRPPRSVWVVHEDLPGVVLVGSRRAEDFFKPA